MKHEVQLTPKTTLTIDDITDGDSIGFITFSNSKGYIARISLDGRAGFSANSLSGDSSTCNYNFSDGGDHIKDALNNTERCSSSNRIKQLFKFDTRKELYKWLAED